MLGQYIGKLGAQCGLDDCEGHELAAFAWLEKRWRGSQDVRPCLRDFNDKIIVGKVER